MKTVRFGCVGDVHEEWDRLDRTLSWIVSREVDALLLVGDFTLGLPAGWPPGQRSPGPRAGPGDRTPAGARDAGGDRPDPAAPTRRSVERARTTGLPLLFVPGNHDVPDVPLEENVDRRRVELAGIGVFGVGGSGPALLGFPYEWTDEELEGIEAPERDLLLVHAPPAGTGLDVTDFGEHVGSRVIRDLAEETDGALVCGHIHESPGVERVGRCLCYNAGSLGAPYGRLQAGLLEMEPGTGAARVRHFVHERAEGWRCVADRRSG